MREYSSSAFICVDDLKDGPRRETITEIVIGQFGRPNATFESGDQLALNKTNTRTLVNAYGPNSQDWIGNTIELCVGTVVYNSEERDSVVVQPISPPKPVAQRHAPVSPPKPDDEIIPF